MRAAKPKMITLAPGTWTLAYTLQTGLNLGIHYPVTGYPSATNPVTGLPRAPATGGLRNLTGRTDRYGRVTLWAVTSTTSGATDTGADPNRLVRVTDRIGATSPDGEAFSHITSRRPSRSTPPGCSPTLAVSPKFA